jgi:putative transcriptional regulator
MIVEANSATGAIMSCPKRPAIDVQAIRLRAGKIGATQDSFANAIGVPVKTLRNWEQHRRKPTGPALTLLLLIQKNPRLVLETMNS